MTKITYIPGEIANAAIDEHGNRKPVTRTHHIFDDTEGKSQAEVNKDVDDTLALHQSEINALNSQNYVTVDSFNALPATGEADTVYRVSNWDGSQQDPTVYSEYAWNGSQYVHLSTKTQIGEVFDISAYHATGGTLATYADLTAALGTNGENVPQSLRKGGMSVKFVQSSDNNYMQFRYLLEYENTTAGNAAFVNTDNWSFCVKNTLAKSPEHLKAVCDEKGHLLCWINKDASIDWAVGVPTPVKRFVEACVKAIMDGSGGTEIDGLNKVIAFLDGFSTSDNLSELLTVLLGEKVDKEVGKSLIDSEYAQKVYVSKSPEWLYVFLEKGERLIEGLRFDGKHLYCDLNVHGNINGLTITKFSDPEYYCLLKDSVGHIISGVKKNGGIEWFVGVPTPIKKYIKENTVLMSENRNIINNIIEDTIQFSNPVAPDFSHKFFGEPSMVIANDGTIIIAAFCGDNQYNEDIMNSYSTDGGITWKTTIGITREIVYDRIYSQDGNNGRLLGVYGSTVYVSYDYGVIWNKLSTIPNKDITEFDEPFAELQASEKEDYDNHVTNKRYAFRRNDNAANSPNPALQLENGVICFVRRGRITKYNATKSTDRAVLDAVLPEGWQINNQGYIVDANGNPIPGKEDWQVDSGGWVVDADNYPVPVNTNFSNIVNIPYQVCYIAYSKDNGETWELSDITPLDVIMDETCIVEAENNQICLNGRGGSERFFDKGTIHRHIIFQKTPVDEKADFYIDEWVTDYETRETNTIEDSYVNAGICKVKDFQVPGSNKEPITFWLFSNVFNPDGYERVNQMLRLSADAHNWLKMRYIKSYSGVSGVNDIIGGYVSLASYNSKIYYVMEGSRNGEPLRFAVLSYDILGEILSSYVTAEKFYK